jgi:exosortase
MIASASPRPIAVRIAWRPLVIIALVAGAYHYSLLTLARGLALQTPLAYVALAPVIAIGLAWFRTSQVPPANPTQLRLDFVLGRVLGVLLIGLALVIALLVPLSIRFWLYRIDLVSLPIFVAGTIALLYGARRLWSLWFPVAFLLLAWPVPYLPLVGDWLAGFTDATVALVTALSHVLPIATAGSEGVFTLHHAGAPFVLAVGSACAGVNSLVGFLLVGTALAYVVRGSLLAKVGWLAVGLVIVWAFNILRIEAIFVVGTLFGPRAALDVLHPVAGLIVFNLGILLMLVVTPRFGLAFAAQPHQVGSEQAPNSESGYRRLSMPALIVLIGVVLMATINSGYARYEGLAGSLGQATVLPFSEANATIPNWGSALLATYQQGQQFYGQNSTWDRYIYQSRYGASLRSSAPVYVDVVATDDANALEAYGVESCYRFHGYFIQSQTDVSLGPALQGHVIDYTNPKASLDWSAIWWEWPYLNGGKTNYERIVIFIQGGPNAQLAGAASDAAPPAKNARFDGTDDFLVTLGRLLVARQLPAVASR